MKISAIIVTYNGEDYIVDCLESLFKSTICLDVFIIDNNSSDATRDIISEYKSKLHEIILLEENLGFGKANNIGLELCMEYDFCFLINQDAYIKADTIYNLLSTWEKHKEYGILSPIHLNADNKYDFMFQNYLNSGKLKDTNLVNVDFVNAALWLISGDCVRKVGLFENVFPHYGEDGNYCDRVRYHGFKIGIVKNAVGWHIRNQKFNIEKFFKIFNLLNVAILINPNYSLGESVWKGLIQSLKICKGRLLNNFQFKTVFLSIRLVVEYFFQLLKLKKYQQIKISSRRDYNQSSIGKKLENSRKF